MYPQYLETYFFNFLRSLLLVSFLGLFLGVPHGLIGAKKSKNAANFVQTHYNKLMKFKNDAKFHSMGFGRGGKYFKWLDAVKKHYARKDLPRGEVIATGFLLGLGQEYRIKKGQETEYSRDAREMIDDYLKGDL